jgi:hypothetical protein
MEIGHVSEGGLAGGEASGNGDPEGSKTPEGERKLAAQLAESGDGAATGLKR